MPVTLTKIDYLATGIEATFELRTEAFETLSIRGEPRSQGFATVFFPYEPEGSLQWNVDRRAHDHLLAHLKAAVGELDAILEK